MTGWIVLISLLGVVGYVQADCYPGDTTYTAIVQQIYHGVTSDRIQLSFHGSGLMTRRQLCSILTNRHNNGKNPGQSQTNRDYLGLATISVSQCQNALTYTQGYNSIAGWQQWAGYHSGNWYPNTGTPDSDGAMWFNPYIKPGTTYVVQPVRFDSQYRRDNCRVPDSTGATCRHGWNQSGQGVLYLWGWDPKDSNCSFGGRRGAHVGFPFSVGSVSCIVWVTTEEAFLECLKASRRTSTTSAFEGYGQWTIIINIWQLIFSYLG